MISIFNKKMPTLVDLSIIAFIWIMIGNGMFDFYVYIETASYVLMTICILFRTNFHIFKNKKIIIPFLIYFSYVTIVGLINDPLVFTLKQILGVFLLFSPLLIYDYCTVAQPSSKNIIGFSIIISIIFFSLVALYYYYFRNVDARRIADKSAYYGNIVIGGGYSLAYGVCILGIFVADRLKHKTNINGHRFLCFLFIMISLLLLFKTGSTITLLMFFFSLLYIILTPNIILKRSAKIVRLCLFIIFVSICIILGGNLVGNLIIKLSYRFSGYLSKRLFSFGSFLLGDSEGIYTINRMLIPIESLSAYIQHPFFGLSFYVGNQYYSLITAGAGGHCEWVDAFTKYGLIGGISFIFLFFSPLISSYKKHNDMSEVIIIAIVIMGLFNPFASSASSLVVMLLIPIFADKFYNNEKEYLCEKL